MHSDPDGQLIHPERRLAEVAHRHPDRADSGRADQLRAAIAHVGTALLDADPGLRRNPPRVPAARVSGDGASGLRRWTAPPGSRPSSSGAGLPSPGPTSDPLQGAFDAWWFSESQYTLALELYQPGSEDRATALRLARLRSRADLRRDQSFRWALV
jgi:hypothetical protein